MSHVNNIADAVALVLDAYAFDEPVAPEVLYDTDLELEDLDTLHCDVVAATMTQTATSRVTLDNEIGVDVALRYRFGTAEQDTDGTILHSEISQHISTLETISRYLAKMSPLPTYREARWIRNQVKASWVPMHLKQNRQYTGIVQAVYVVEDDLS